MHKNWYIFYTEQPNIVGVCQAPVGNRSPRLWWVITGHNHTHSSAILETKILDLCFYLLNCIIAAVLLSIAAVNIEILYYSHTPIYRAPIYRVPRFTVHGSFPPIFFSKIGKKSIFFLFKINIFNWILKQAYYGKKIFIE